VAGLVMDGFGYVALNLFAAVLVTGVATAAEIARRTTRQGPRDAGVPAL
jgi:hypothetical protein